MNRPNKLFWIGILVYVSSFFLRAVGDSIPNSTPLRGYHCAMFALTLPLKDLHDFVFGGPTPVLSFFSALSLFVSGLINPVLVVTLILDVIRPYDRIVSRLRYALLFMIPFCWAFFYLENQRPMAGHFIWIAGILLTIYSERIAKLRF